MDILQRDKRKNSHVRACGGAIGNLDISNLDLVDIMSTNEWKGHTNNGNTQR